jgi:hypothetical protein
MANALKQLLNDGSVDMATKPGLYANIHAKQARIAAGSGEKIIMPLVKSKSPEAFRKNVKAEVAAGKPVKQAVAIAYSVKREAQKTPAKKK